MKKWPLFLGGCAAAAWAGASCYAFYKGARRYDHNSVEEETDDKPEDQKRMGEALKRAASWLEDKQLEDVEITSMDGLSLKGHLLRCPEETDRVVLAVHGYTGDWRDLTIFAPFYYDHGWNVLFVNDRGHGESEGNFVGFGSQDRKDVLGWIQFLISRFGPSVQILLHGWSMGGAIVLLAGAEKELPPQVKGIVADCSYTSALEQFESVCRKKASVPPDILLRGADLSAALMAGYRLRDCAPIDSVDQINIPVLFVHGSGDEFVPCYMTDRLYHACKSPEKKILTVKGAGHCMSYLEGKQEFQQALEELMETACR